MLKIICMHVDQILSERGARNCRPIYSFNRHYLYFFIHSLNIYFGQTFFSKRNMFCNTATGVEYVVNRASVNVTVAPPNVCKIVSLKVGNKKMGSFQELLQDLFDYSNGCLFL